ncbi:hypothetical protein WQE_18164 [Paraburkholderia hospita]|uniref:Tetratricopeptide repeat-containing protein n=1 Tax=Paraburkholderia hospita TaxID=169430 RepID=A0ABP2PP32_9BURK|nr:tetratricopeptide repeat protein [Paraburkholderia hospita]EIM99587.1 hypothetical protein WQE_18164 [Paraburkholderia hospita]OUL72633.1 hypothetical protein CA602_42880 [Paraburkholderia hospita]
MIKNAKPETPDEKPKTAEDPTQIPGSIATSDLELAVVRPSRLGSLTRFFAYHLPLYLIVGTLVLIAIPKPITDQLFGVAVTGVVAAHAAPANSGNGAAAVADGSAAAAQPLDKSTAEIARMTLEDSRDKYVAIKENYDRLFSVIAAMAALIAFLGFRGLDSYVTTKETAENLVKRATKAQADAERSRRKLDDFISNKYKEDNKAEINVTTGIVLRHVADSHARILQRIDPSADPLVDHKYKDDLLSALQYLKRAKEYPNVDSGVAVRAISTMGNVYKRLGRYEDAIEILEHAIEKYTKTDESIYYNIACYACLAAEKFAKEKNARDSDKMIQKALSNLRRSVELASDYAADALTDQDFQWLRATDHMGFKALTDQRT